MIKLIASDMDGTLLNHNHKIPKENVELINYAKNQGIEFIVATGRAYYEALPALNEENINCDVISFNGGIVYDKNGNIISITPMLPKDLYYTIEILKSFDISYQLYTKNTIYTKSIETDINAYIDLIRSNGYDPDVEHLRAEAQQKLDVGYITEVENIELYLNEKENPPIKIIAISNDISKLENAAKLLLENKSISVTSSGANNIEIMHKNATKGEALKEIAKIYGINLENAVAIGARANATHQNAVALGSASTTRDATKETQATVGNITYSGFAGTDGTAVVSVGKDFTRQIVNVGAGNISATSTDAINGSQLYAVASQVSKNGDNIANNTVNITKNAGNIANNTANITKNADNIANNTANITKNAGNIANNTANITKNADNIANNTQLINQNTQNIANNKNAINQLERRVNDTDRKINRVDRRSRAGIAGVAAIASAPNARKDGKSMISAGVAHHRGESAIAIKASRNSDNGKWSSNVNGASDTRGQFTVGAGVGYEW